MCFKFKLGEYILICLFPRGVQPPYKIIYNASLVPLAHTCNPSYLGDWDWENGSSRPTWARIVHKPPSPKTWPERNDWRCCSSSRVPALQAWNPEFKSQSHQKKKMYKRTKWILERVKQKEKPPQPNNKISTWLPSYHSLSLQLPAVLPFCDKA
jgi:hypothetical protein